MQGSWWRRMRQRRARRREERVARIVAEVESLPGLWNAPGDRPGTCAGTVIRHRQRARFGLKAYVEWWGDGVTAVWFRGIWPEVGTLVAAKGQMGWGRHHDEPVFFVKEVRAVVPRGVVDKYRRIKRKQLATTARA